MNCTYHCYASAAFGMEGLVAEELRQIGLSDVSAENGGVRFSANAEQIFLCNLRMHFSERVFLILASSRCTSFEALFNLVYSIDWNMFFDFSESIDVSCKCSRSTLMSPRDCQSITKKAVIEKIKKLNGQTMFPESGPSLPIHVTIRNDYAMIMLNTSGDALSRRGYRTWNGEAPIRETLAAALVHLSGWHPGQPLHDPCCGTGTILIEAALYAAGRAPGISRTFAMEKNKCFRHPGFSAVRSAEAEKSNLSRISDISGSDIDPVALDLARRHVHQAGLDISAIPLKQVPLQELCLDSVNGVFVCNPPYGERLSDQKRCHILYHDLFLLCQRHPSWRMCVISSDPAFERYFGKKASRKRRLYNGRLECTAYVYDQGKVKLTSSII